MIFSILATVAFVWGLAVGKASSTMTSGPREGTRNGGFLVAGIAGLAFGLFAALIGAAPLVAGLFIGGLTALAATGVGFVAGNAISR